MVKAALNCGRIFLVGLLLFSNSFALQLAENKAVTIPEAGDTAEDFMLKDFQGKSFSLSDFRNRKAIVLWFTNLCEGCQAKFSQIEKLRNEYSHKNLEVVAVSQLDKDRKTVEDAIRKHKMTVRFLYDPTGEATAKFAGKYVPNLCPLKNIFFIDKGGIIVHSTHYPGVSEEEIAEQIEKLVKEN